MKSWFSYFMATCLVALVAVGSACPRLCAENPPAPIQPIAVVSIASVEEVLGDIAFLTESAGQGDFGKMVALLSGGYTVGMDKKRPAGMLVTIKNDEPNPLLFLPVKNLDAVLAGIEEQVGKPQDAGNGILELTGGDGKPFYVKEVEGWAYVAKAANDLEKLPQIDPAAVLGDLTKNYTVAVRINAANIPDDMKKVAVAQMKAQFERSLREQLEKQPDQQRALTERASRNMLEEVTSLIQDSEEFTVGLQVDGQTKSTHLDISLIAKAGTKLAAQMDLMKEVTSSQAGFLAPDAAVHLHVASRINQEDMVLYQDMLKTARENTLKEVENDQDIETEEARQIARDVVNALFDVGEKTVAAGKVDGGAALFLTPTGKLNFVAGASVKDASRLEETFKKLADAAKNEPKAPKVNFDAVQHAGVRFHTMSLPIPAKENEAQQLFGENLDVALGFGQESLYVAFGPAGIDTTKAIIDNSKSRQAENVAPAQFVVSLGPILKFASAVKEDPVTTMLASVLDKSQGQDHISVKAQSVERGVRYRLEVEQGVLQLVGAAVKMFNNQRKQAPNLF